MIGARARRLEDPRLLRGHGRFVDDVDLVHQAALRVVRSPIAAGRIERIDTTAAARVPGVLAVLTADDLDPLPRIPMRLIKSADPVDFALQPVLATEVVRYVGEPVAVVVAEDAYIAEDAAELVSVDYVPTPAVVDSRAALEDGAPSLWDGHSNEVATIRIAFGDADAVFREATHVVELDLKVGRHSGVPLETRGTIAHHDRARDHLDIWGWTKVPHFNRRVLAQLLDMPVNHIHVHGVDAGGGFGIRGELYPEDVLVPIMARRLGRPVKWIEDRTEHLLAANHSREQWHRVAGAFDEDGKLLALRDEVWHDNGAYMRTHGVTVPDLTARMLPGPYDVGSYDCLVHVVTTNKTPAGTYRGPGRYETTYVREHLMNAAAVQLGIDRVELRRRNLITTNQLPYTRPITVLGVDMVVPNGDYVDLLDRALQAADFAAWDEEARAARREGRLVGTGIAFFQEKSGRGPYETAGLEVDRSGKIRVTTGGASLGQGIETVLGQIAAEVLDVTLDDIEVLHGDTDLIDDGVGSWSSRSTVVGGSAVRDAAQQVADRACRVAAGLLGVDERKVHLEGGRVLVRGTDSGMTLGDVAAACDALSSVERGETPGLKAATVFAREGLSFPYGVHLAQVEIDPATGGVAVRRYLVAYEIGRAINPQLVEGQLIGGVAQGIGGALFEDFSYDDSGQPQCTTFMDYLMPTSAEVPHVQTLISEDHPAPDNPLGAMGAGEGGCTGAAAAVAGAIADALQMPNAASQLPATPERIWQWLEERRTAS